MALASCAAYGLEACGAGRARVEEPLQPERDRRARLPGPPEAPRLLQVGSHRGGAYPGFPACGRRNTAIMTFLCTSVRVITRRGGGPLGGRMLVWWANSRETRTLTPVLYRFVSGSVIPGCRVGGLSSSDRSTEGIDAQALCRSIRVGRRAGAMYGGKGSRATCLHNLSPLALTAAHTTCTRSQPVLFQSLIPPARGCSAGVRAAENY
jgi:hypothetical protein